MKGKIQYHHRAKQMSVDKSTQEILNSSPILEKKNKEFVIENKMKLDDDDDDDENVDDLKRRLMKKLNNKT